MTWNIIEKPSLEGCPEKYCFCWTPPGGTADLSGKEYDTFEGAIDTSKKGVTFIHGGCAAPLGPCRRGTKNLNDRDNYEPFERVLKKYGLPNLFFCNPDNLAKEYIEEYKIMAKKLWGVSA